MNKEKKKIEPKNYLILVVIVVLTVIAVLYMRNLYIMTKEYNAKNSVILEVAKEINENEINNYCLENPKFILYVSSGQNGNIKSFEKEMKKTIQKNDLEEMTLYVNTDKVDPNNLKRTLTNLSQTEKIKDKINTNSEVSIYVIENGKITKAIIQADKISPNQVEKILQKYGVIDND